MTTPKTKKIVDPRVLREDNITVLINRAKQNYSFGKIKTLGQLLVFLGHTQGELEYAYGTQQLATVLDRQLLHHTCECFRLRNLVMCYWPDEYENRTVEVGGIQFHVGWDLSCDSRKEQNEALKGTDYYDNRSEDNKFNTQLSTDAGSLQENNNTNIQESQSEDKVSKENALVSTQTTSASEVEVLPKDWEKEKEIDRLKPAATEQLPNSLWTPEAQHPKQTAHLWKQQEKAAQVMYDGIVRDNKTGMLTPAAVGKGKTFVLGAILRHLYDNGWKPLVECKALYKVIYVTKASIVTKTQRDLRQHFGLDTANEVSVVNIDQFRAMFGELFIEWKTTVEAGQEYTKPVWKKWLHPVLIIWDECQTLKNLDSQQSKIGQAFNDIIENYGVMVYQIFASATPFTRVCEAKCFAVATHCLIDIGWKKVPLTNAHWPEFAKKIAHPADPTEHSPAAIERLMNYLKKDYMVDILGIRPQFHAHNMVEIIPFGTEAEKKDYDDAIEEYQREKNKIESANSLSGGEKNMCMLAIFTILRRKAEVIRYRELAARSHHDVQEGYAAVVATCFKPTIAMAVRELVDKYGVPRNQISLIWGGMSSKVIKTKKQREKAEAASEKDNKKNAILARYKAIGINPDDIEGLDEMFGTIDDKFEANRVRSSNESSKIWKPTDVEIKRYGLGPQDYLQRQREIDRFQNGQSLYAFFTFKAGGVGLSLHHTDEFTTFKCRKKPHSDYVMEEDIPKVPTRPRKSWLTPTYSAVELVQGLGRAPRLTSLSDTPQTILFYRGTIEERVAATVSVKLRCLKKVVMQKESWEQIITEAKGSAVDEANYDAKQLPPPTKSEQHEASDEDDDIFLGGGLEDDED